MPYTSDPYTKTVCACLRYATAKEKTAVQAELEAHIEDHTEALLAAGYDAGHAQRLAVEAMGDPQDVGQALNEAFPRRWWVLSRLAAFALVASVVLLVLYLPAPIGQAHNYYQAKYDPMSFDWHLDTLPELVPLDFQYDLPGGSTLFLYAVGLAEGEAGAYTAYLCAVDYSGGPFQPISACPLPGKQRPPTPTYPWGRAAAAATSPCTSCRSFPSAPTRWPTLTTTAPGLTRRSPCPGRR